MANKWRNGLINSADVVDIMRRLNALESIEDFAFGAEACYSSSDDIIYVIQTADFNLPIGGGATPEFDDGVGGAPLVAIHGFSGTTGRLVKKDHVVIPNDSSGDLYGRIACDGSGNLYLWGWPADQTTGTTVRKYSSAGMLIATQSIFSPPHPSGFDFGNSSVNATFVWRGGNLYIAHGSSFWVLPDTLGLASSGLTGLRIPKAHGPILAAVNVGGEDKFQHHAGSITGSEWNTPLDQFTFVGLSGGAKVFVESLITGRSLVNLANSTIKDIDIPFIDPNSGFWTVPFETTPRTDVYELDQGLGFFLYDNVGGLVSEVLDPPTATTQLIRSSMDAPDTDEFIVYGDYGDVAGTGSLVPSSMMAVYDINTGNFLRHLPELGAVSGTEWFAYPTSTTSVSIGTIPVLSALLDEASMITPQIIIDLRAALITLTPKFTNSITGNPFNTTPGSADNLYNVAIGNRSVYGDTTGTQYYDYRLTEVQMNNTEVYDLEIGEIWEQLLVLEAAAGT